MSTCPGSDQHCRHSPFEPRSLCAYPCVAHVGPSVTPCRARLLFWLPPHQRSTPRPGTTLRSPDIAGQSGNTFTCNRGHTCRCFRLRLAAFPTDPIRDAALSRSSAQRKPVDSQHTHPLPPTPPLLRRYSHSRQLQNHREHPPSWLNSCAPRFSARRSRSQAGAAAPHILISSGTDREQVHRPTARGHGRLWARLVCLSMMRTESHIDSGPARRRISSPARPWPSRRS